MQSENFYSYLASVLNEARKKQTEEDDEIILDGVPKIKKAEEEIPEEEIPVEEPLPEELSSEEAVSPEEIPPEEPVDPAMADDASYMNLPPEPAAPTIDDVTKQEQKKKLFDEFYSLRNLIDYTYTNFSERLNLDLMDGTQIRGLDFVNKSLSDLIKKIEDFLLKSFVLREYEECLYTYMLLRSEFLTTIKYVRKLLNLNVIKDDEK